MVRIGKFIITQLDDDKVWISIINDGEGGEFKTAELEKIIAEHYKEKF